MRLVWMNHVPAPIAFALNIVGVQKGGAQSSQLHGGRYSSSGSADHRSTHSECQDAPGVAGTTGTAATAAAVRFSRNALATTDTELKLIANAASIGLSNHPVSGYSTPAAIGTPSAL